ncbi:MAG TPA: MBL fold metallo-hydrolase [Ktedonobacteraceae bacterium]
MQVAFLGGASGVGASCLAIELDEQWFVVDAGVRVDHKGDPLPDLAQLEGKNIRAIFVTHAHADHIGALPLLHRAFPTTPIFTSRGTALLMEVMLADALKIMAKRAVEEMELPLYPEELVAGMLMQVRPMPTEKPFTVPMLPGITIHASRAGHIVGAVSLAFKGASESIVVSGDISSTPQRTVLGAVPPPLKHCDLLILESTYGSRLHPNRQAEEQRLAQAVAEGLARGGHTLIPCFGLGRGQEILLLLQAAQEQGQIPDFPIYVDGLVRRVCTTYQLMPEFLAPRLQRQIRKGYLPFTGPNIIFVRDEKERERILAGPPACILSSSGMLTGGPSAWYAARLAPNPNASILITGYQDEEAPGKKLLDLAERKQNTLELGGQQVQVQCTVAKYSLSAHADGGELASYASALNPRNVALVHGDEDARKALRSLLTGTEVLLPTNGTSMRIERKSTRAKHAVPTEEVPVQLPTLPTGIGDGRPFEYPDVEKLWQAVVEVPTLRIITARELALVWYGEATEENTESILDTFAQDYEQRYFVRQSALEEAYRIRGQHEEAVGDFLSDLPRSVILLLVSFESAKPAICRSIEPGAAIRVQLPRDISQERTRFPFSSILEVLGPVPLDVQQANTPAGTYLSGLVKTMRRIRRTISAHDLASRCREKVTYTLGDLCVAAGLSPQSLEDRLALAKVLHQHVQLFTQSRGVFEGEGLTLYELAPEWQEALEEDEEYERPDQNWILSVIENYFGSPADLYRRSVDPDTGAVILYFHFPAVAKIRYAEAITAATEEAGVPISIAPNAHQGILAKTACQHIPQSLTVQGTPSIYFDRSIVSLNCIGQATEAEIASAQSQFCEETGWQLAIKGAIISESAQSDRSNASNEIGASQNVPTLPNLPVISSQVPEAITPVSTTRTTNSEPMSQHDAIQLAQQILSKLPGYYKAGGDVATTTLLLRFYFPLVAQTRYADVFAELEAQTGWQVRLYQTTHQQALVEMARNVLPSDLTCNGVPSLYLDQQMVMVNYVGHANSEALQDAQQQFLAKTGWHLRLTAPGKKKGTSARMQQAEAKALTSEIFKEVPDFYRVGVDTDKGILWVHFHFPDRAKDDYAQQIADLANQTGWKVFLYPYVHQKALIEAARHLLPEGVSVNGKVSLYQDSCTLTLTCIGSIPAEQREDIQQQFSMETGWTLDLRTPVEEFYIAPEP